MSDDEQVKLSLFTDLNCVGETQGRSHQVTLAPKKQFAGAKQRFVVRNGKYVFGHFYDQPADLREQLESVPALTTMLHKTAAFREQSSVG